MTIQPTVAFKFEPHCKRLSCCLGSDEFYPTKRGKFKPINSMSDEEVFKANIRFREIVLRKIDALPLDNEEFLDRLEHEEGISLKVTREDPLTKRRLQDTVRGINKVLGRMHIE